MARDVFYKMHKGKTRQLFDEAKELAFEVFVDEKDELYHRVPSRMTYEEVMKLFDKSCHVVIAERNVVFGNDKPFFQVAFCTMGMEVPGDYFLWLHLSLEHLPRFVKKYDLKIL